MKGISIAVLITVVAVSIGFGVNDYFDNARAAIFWAGLFWVFTNLIFMGA